MARVSRDRIDLNPVDTYEVSPHKFLYAHPGDYYDYRDAPTWKEFKEGMPYKAGEVVYVKYHDELRKAFIEDVFIEYNDYFGTRMEKFRVRLENKKGNSFAKSWVYVYPGDVQRGYIMAGLASDVPV